MKIPAKFKSIKFIISLWAMALLTYIVLKDLSDMNQVAMILSAAPMAYCYANVKQKEIYQNAPLKGDR